METPIFDRMVVESQRPRWRRHVADEAWAVLFIVAAFAVCVALVLWTGHTS